MPTRRILLIALLATVFVSLLALAGCGGTTTDTTSATGQTTDTQPATETASAEGDTLYTPSYQPNGNETVIMKTSQGDITIELYGKDAPIHVGNFIELAKKGFYDGVKFHRYEPGFVIQGGDPQTKDVSGAEVKKAVESGNSLFGTGGPGYVIKGEFDAATNPHKHEEGALGMARTQNPDSAGSQFYFALQALPQLDGSYTVFGKVTKGLDVVKKLRVGDEIKSVEVLGANN